MYIKIISLFFLLERICISESLKIVIHPDRDLSITQIFAKYRYPVEEHKIITEDGYILKAYRIPNGKNINSTRANRYPVMMVHGTCGCSENFIISGPDKALPYYLANRNFDVWLLNTRGNRHSRKHLKLNPNTDKKFWDFGWHEVAVYDIPATIDYILFHTNKTSLFYVGHSQGSTVYFAFASERPEYNKKIKLAVNMAPSALLGDTRNLVKIAGKHSALIKELADLLNIHELFPNEYNPFINFIGKTLCADSHIFLDLCNALLYFGEIEGDMEEITPQFVFSTSPARCSIKQLIHYFQIVFSGIFRQYDYGHRANLRVYGTKTPPEYSFSNMTSPIALFYTARDMICPMKGVIKLSQKLPNVASMYQVPSDNFNHVDFLFGKSVIKLVNEPILNLFQKYMKQRD